MPLTGAFIGFLMWVLAAALKSADLEEVAFLSYFLIEGINHVDGLSDFFDSVFARNKVRALKDTKVGVGGVVSLASFTLVLYSAMPHANPLDLMLAQSLAKSSMLLLLLRNDAAWEGMAKVFRENVRTRDYIGLLFSLILVAALGDLRSIQALIVFLLVVFSIEFYSRKHFSGISGDVLGAANCLTFAAVILCLQ